MQNTKMPRRRRDVRTYESPLRIEQAEQTRLRIIQAYGDEVCSGTDSEITVRQVARRAGVSVPTLYRNFASLDELGDAYWAWFEPKLASFDDVASADDLPGLAEGLFARFGEYEPQVRALFVTSAGRRMRDRSVPRRNQAFQRLLAPLTKSMPERDALAVAAVCKILASGQVWQILRQDWGLNDTEAGQAAAWAMRVLIQSLRQSPKPRSILKQT